MTEGSLPENGKSMCVRVWLEVGHTCEPRQSSLGRSLALDWRVWVQGRSGTDISAFVHKVVFYLRPPEAFVYPKRVIEKPPYEIQESGCASIEIPIHVYLKYSEKPKKIRLKYSLNVENNVEINTRLRSVFYDLENPTEILCKCLMKSGGEIIAHARSHNINNENNDLVVELSHKEHKDKLKKVMKAKKYKFIEPIHYKKLIKKTTKAIEEKVVSKFEYQHVDFYKLLKPLAMTNDEINEVSQLYWSFSAYEKSLEALSLPPFSDSVFKMPDLPIGLKSALKTDEPDYCLS